DRLAELLAGLRIAQRVLVRAHHAADRLPADVRARHAKHASGVAERHLPRLQLVRRGHATVLHGDQRVLNHAQRHLVLDLLRLESGRLVLDDEALHLIVPDVARPDDRDVAEGGVADPLLLAVQDPGVAFAARRRSETARGPRTGE